MLTAEYLRDVLTYDPAAGSFIWKERPSSHFRSERYRRSWNTRHSGKNAGGYLRGYLRITIDYNEYQAGRIAWLYMTGEWPLHEVDHEDDDSSNNKWENLRDATPSQNNANKHAQKCNKFGKKGVSFSKREHKYSTKVRKDGKYHWLGYFDNAEDAAAEYARKSKELHGEFARHTAREVKP